MSETYKALLPGNWVNRLNAYPLPNADFIAKKHPPGYWDDRQTQAVNWIPGWLAVMKTGIFKFNTRGDKVWTTFIPSPYTRGDDKPFADVEGIVVPAGALLYRAGLRIPSVGTQPAFSSQGSVGPYKDLTSGIVAENPQDQLVLATQLPAARNTGTITAAAANTSNTPADAAGVVPVGGNVLTSRTDLTLPIGQSAVTAVPGSANAAVLTADLTFSVYSLNAAGTAAGGLFKSLVPGGLYGVAEVAYLVPDTVGTLDDIPLPGHQYAGYSG